MTDDAVATGPDERWLTRGVAGIGAASLLSDLGHEVPTALLPRFLTATLGAPAAALGLIEGIADGCAGVARFAGGALADDPERRRRGRGRRLHRHRGLLVADRRHDRRLAGRRLARGRLVVARPAGPARNALLADVVPPEAYGRAYGFERAMDNLGAIGGPLLAIALVALVGVRTAMLVSVIPGLLATRRDRLRDPRDAARRPSRRGGRSASASAPCCRGSSAGCCFGISAFELGNVAATLLILRATQLLTPSARHDRAVKIALVPLHRLQPRRHARERPRRPSRRPPRHPARAPARRRLLRRRLHRVRAHRRLDRAARAVSSSSPGSGSASSRPPSTPPSPRSPRPRSAAPRSARSPRSSRSATSPPARSPDCSGPRLAASRVPLPRRVDVRLARRLGGCAAPASSSRSFHRDNSRRPPSRMRSACPLREHAQRLLGAGARRCPVYDGPPLGLDVGGRRAPLRPAQVQIGQGASTTEHSRTPART